MTLPETPTQLPIPTAASKPGVDKQPILLTDPTVWHWWFFLRGHAFDSQSKKDQHWTAFQPALHDAIKWAAKFAKNEAGKIGEKPVSDEAMELENAWKLSNVKRPQTEPPENEYPLLFAKVPTRDGEELIYSFQGRSLLDSTYLRFRWTVPGAFDAQAFAELRQKDWRYEKNPAPFLGEAVCLMAEVPATVDIRESKNIIREVLANWHGQDIREVKVIEFACGFYGITDKVEETVWVVLIRDGDQSRDQARRLANDISPRFLLAWLKGRFIRQEFDKSIVSSLNEKEKGLEDVLYQVTGVPRNNKLKALEDTTLAVTGKLEVFSTPMYYVNDYLQTLSVNIYNLEQLIKDPLFGEGSAMMDGLLVAPLRQSENQIKKFLEYKNITRDRARLKLEMDSIQVDILRERLMRGITILLGLFVIFGVVQAFDAELKAVGQRFPLNVFENELSALDQAWPKLAVTAIGFLILSICILLYSRKR